MRAAELAAFLVAAFLGATFLGASGRAVAAQCPVDSNREMVDAIAAGHAYDRHVVEEQQYQHPVAGAPYRGPEIKSHDDFAHLLEAIVSGSDPHRALAHDRAAYWDATTGTVVILNAHSKECGTAFRPDSGQQYFDRLK